MNIKNYNSIAFGLSVMGSNPFSSNERYDELLDQAQNLPKELIEKMRVAQSLYNLGLIVMEEGSLDRALKAFSKVSGETNRLPANKMSISNIVKQPI